MHTWSCRHIHTNNIGGCGAGGHNSYAQLVLQTHTHHTQNNLGGCGAGGHNSYAQLVLQTHTHKQHWRMWSWRSQLTPHRTTLEDVELEVTTHMLQTHTHHTQNNLGGCGAGGQNSYAQLVLQTQTHHTQNKFAICRAGNHNLTNIVYMCKGHTHININLRL